MSFPLSRKHSVPLALFTGVIILLLFTGQKVVRNVRGSGGILILNQADSLFLDGNLKAALESLDRDILNNPDNPAILYNRGLLEHALHRGTGLEWFRNAHSLAPDSPDINHMLGVALADEGKLKESIQYLEKAVKNGKDFYQAEVDLGRILRLLGQPKEAIPVLKSAIKQGRNYPYAYTELAEAWMAQGRRDLARLVLLDGYERFPYEGIVIELVRFFIEEDMPESVVWYGEMYLKYYPKGENTEEVLKALAKANPEKIYTADGIYCDLVYPDSVGITDPAKALPLGKRLSYQARWGFFKLGALDIDVHEGEYRGEPSWRIQYIIRTYPGLPFISVIDTIHSHITRDIRHSMSIKLHYYERDFTAYETYRFHYDTGRLYIGEVHADGYWLYVEHSLPPNVFDALSMTWIAQQFVLAKRSGEIHTGISAGYELTRMNFIGPDKTLKLAGREWETVKVDGRMRYAGVVGLTGDYIGWFSADERALPLFAKFKIFIGSISMRLISIQPSPEPTGPDW